MNSIVIQLPLAFNHPWEAFTTLSTPCCKHYPLITSQRDSECVSAPTDSEMKCRSAEEDKFERITMDPTGHHEKQTHKCKVNILQLFCTLWKCQRHPIKNQVSSLRNDRRQYFPPALVFCLLLAPRPPYFIACLREESCGELGSESYYVKMSRNWENILSKFLMLLLNF